MNRPKQQHIFIYDHPESRIRFLETSLGDQDWIASIVVPKAQADDPQQEVDALEAKLRARGYVTSQSIEADDTVNLHLHHFASHSAPADALAEMGLVKGTAFTLQHAGPNLAKMVHSAMKLGGYLVKEPARLFSSIYLIGDTSYTLSGWVEAKKHGQRTDFFKPENFLSSLSGLFAFAQSSIVMKYGNNGGELNYSELKNQFKTGERTGIDAMNVKGWTGPGMTRRWFGALGETARQYPIDVGSWAQVAGQGALMGASAFQIKNAVNFISATPHLAAGAEALTLGQKFNALRQVTQGEWWQALKTPDTLAATMPLISARKQTLGAGINILRACVSMSAWHMLMRPAKPGGITADWSHPLTRIHQEIEHHPERAAGLINFSASLIGLTASHIKGNRAGIFAEVMWLAGDLVMMFARKNHYGAVAAHREIPLIDAATRFVKEMPIAASASRKESIICDLARYLAQKTIDDETNTKQARTAPITEEIDALQEAIAAGVNANLSMVNTIFDRLTTTAAILIERFAPAEREGIITSLAHGMAAAPGIYASEEELVVAIRSHTDLTSGFGIDKPSIGVLARDIAQVITESPPIAKAGIANAIYDAILPVIKTSPSDHLLLAQAIQESSVEAGTAIVSRENQSWQQKLGTDAPASMNRIETSFTSHQNPNGLSHAARIANRSGTPVQIT